MAVNAPTLPAANDPVVPDRPPAGPQPRTWRSRDRAARGEVRIYQHSNLLYWWVVWVYGFICAALTYAQGIGVPQLAASADKQILFHGSPWLGASFIGLILFVVVFTNVRARGVYSFVLMMLAVGLGWGIAYLPGIDKAMSWASLLRIHLNLAFYLTFSVLLMLIWLFVTTCSSTTSPGGGSRRGR